MCGIVGYVGQRPAQELLLDALKKLEYRGYDSAGIALVEGTQLFLAKRAGKVNELAETLSQRVSHATVGLGHTRWATHGPPNRSERPPSL